MAPYRTTFMLAWDADGRDRSREVPFRKPSRARAKALAEVLQARAATVRSG
jgi:hypothetical protein